MKKIIIDETVSYDCGLMSAAILYWLKGEYDKNKINNINYLDNNYWVDISIRKLSNVYKFLSPSKVVTSLKKLLENDYIIKHNTTNSDNGNSANWYTITNKGLSILNDNE